MKNFYKFRKVYPWGTIKSTLNHESLPYLFESAKFLMDIGLEFILMNTVYEDVWKLGDEDVFKKQLYKLADYLLEDKRYERYNTSLFNESLLEPYDDTKNWCGCGTCMTAVDYKGDLYPCLRFKTVDKQQPWTIGNIYDGYDTNKMRPFYFCHHLRVGKCKECESKSGCATCPGLNYDETGNVFERATYICEMHKARISANKYFFDKIAEIEGRMVI
jgi:uncharacterized protein